jgi:predicted nuclease of predicted toxin-antitoxin system
MAGFSEIRFLLDEHIPYALLDGLRRRNIDVTSVDELRLKGTDDPDLLELAKNRGCVIVTQDTDFLVDPPSVANHAGIIFVRDGMSIGSVLQVVQLIHGAYSSDEMTGRIEHASSLE